MILWRDWQGAIAFADMLVLNAENMQAGFGLEVLGLERNEFVDDDEAYTQLADAESHCMVSM